MRKYLIFAIIAVAAVLLDQGTKWVATDRLAGAGRGYEHIIEVYVPESADGSTLEAFLEDELSANSRDEVATIASQYVRDYEGKKLSAGSELNAGDVLHITRRKTVVVPGFWEHEYARNPGAAFGFLANADSAWRLPFFIVVGIVALGVILMILRGTRREDYWVIVSLSFIAGGAIGNFIDRVRFGWVTDFIVWRLGEARWPTFNVADAFISIGVAMMAIEIIRDGLRERREAKSKEL